MSRITDQAKSIIPSTWVALTDASEVGDPVLSARAEYVETLILGAVPTDDEQDDMSILVIEYIAKALVLEIYDAAVDYWKEQLQSVVINGPNEQESYANRLDSLKELKAKLIADLLKLEPIVTPLIPNLQTRKSTSGVPLLSSLGVDMLTPDPTEFGPAYNPVKAV